jgi:hypothetical protein
MLTNEQPEGYTLWAAQCFVSIDGRLQNRVCISRDATHTSLLFRCNFIHEVAALPLRPSRGVRGRFRANPAVSVVVC